MSGACRLSRQARDQLPRDRLHIAGILHDAGQARVPDAAAAQEIRSWAWAEAPLMKSTRQAVQVGPSRIGPEGAWQAAARRPSPTDGR